MKNKKVKQYKLTQRNGELGYVFKPTGYFHKLKGNKKKQIDKIYSLAEEKLMLRLGLYGVTPFPSQIRLLIATTLQ